MDKHERVVAAQTGRAVDRPPVSTWRHCVDREQSALFAAGCSVGPSTPTENLLALRDAARAWRV